MFVIWKKNQHHRLIKNSDRKNHNWPLKIAANGLMIAQKRIKEVMEVELRINSPLIELKHFSAT